MRRVLKLTSEAQRPSQTAITDRQPFRKTHSSLYCHRPSMKKMWLLHLQYRTQNDAT